MGVVNTTESSSDAPLTPSVELAQLVASMPLAVSATVTDAVASRLLRSPRPAPISQLADVIVIANLEFALLHPW
jgi:hypothetical protein